ncbi:MAG: hypothetical protein COV32_02895 [Candidatus Yonathbacteria bacterium CG10_big_fil_rev_8_21_14_0_10_43_136]|uniref:Uncharacterized protein n=2 Tax=Parcubacteria group TaxID=1794811 RepID=A0A2M7Q473_9BACT|nr:MAG: hypothetical protein AUK15_01530 [Candidatus Nomurabacteria bacterium CG2_30_43_9]PIQ36117.1 MAG: hypothetical protein COW60_00335 [Candidatus Yonathbacteria bacterium CG17_big_fil_post_rev_8_21_14_2_50_43_9]PIR40510.1 MAG: hypothetical protein COV32_02895 [Candidatus Yonathbacteria bacterium CG10_big_fil_rev_8_21_14_0_10_43_136]PIX57523.1 MAG: hypothetical protein COZ48_00410 [Candidatus Yonathbacteria bacterium CG_4_10_14_3_um_filter_43_12]PIY58217.1 MAG: hypothetical protein COY98_03
MKNQELRDILIKELSIGELPEEAQDEIVVKLGEVILKSLTIAIFDKLSSEARVEFEKIGAKNDTALIQEFLEENIPDMHTLMEEEVRRTLQNYAELEAGGGKPKAREGE